MLPDGGTKQCWLALGGGVRCTPRSKAHARLAAALCVLTLVMPVHSSMAQVGSGRVDPATGDFLVKILDEDGNLVELRVPAGNKVVGSVTTDATVLPDGRWRYRYLLRLSPASPQALMSFDIPCVRNLTIAEPTARSFSRAEGPSNGIFEHVRYPDRSVCEVVGGDLRSGDSLAVQFMAGAAPGLGDVHLSGAAAGPVWPGEERAENMVAVLVVDSLLNELAGWAKVASVVPSRSLSSLSSVSAVFAAVSDDLRTACDAAKLITEGGLCRSLRAKLNAAADAISRGQSQAAAHQVRAFQNELTAQRGKAVSEDAFVDLMALSGLLLSRLP